MKLDDLCAVFDRSEFPPAGVPEHPGREAVLAARQAVTAAVRDDTFLIDCLAHELADLEHDGPRRGLVPFYVLPALGISFAFGYWPPGSHAGAHQHSAWTITAVCRNELVVNTFDREESIRQQKLVPKNTFEAVAGRVGFIYEPCIHDPHNPTKRWSLSLHVSSPRDGEQLDDDACLPVLDGLRAQRSTSNEDPYARLVMVRHRQVLIDVIARFIAGMDVRAGDDLLARCSRLGAAPTRRFIDGLGRTGIEAHGSAARLTLTHDELTLTSRNIDGCVALGVETPDGWVEQLRMAGLGREAVTFCTTNTAFEVDDIPGALTNEERWAIAEALEEAGMFRMEVC